MSLAERLNLHAPFRSFGNGNDFEDLNDSRIGRARKRHRSPSSTSSDLEPAALPEPLNDKMDHKLASKHKRCGRHDDTTSESASKPSQSLSDTFVSPEKPIKTYAKRLRHKTKEDRYELKQNKAAVKQKRDKKDRQKAVAKKDKKSKLHKRSGAALVPNFEAQNVAQDRLTVWLLSRGEPSHSRENMLITCDS